MSSEWPLVEISTICEGIFDGPHATPQKTEQGPIFLGISSLNKGRLDLSKLEYLSEDDFKKWTRRITPKAGDLVFSYETRLGEVAMIPEGLRCCLGRRMALMRINQEKAIPEYVLYAYLSPLFQDVIRARTIHGSTVDRIPLMEFGTFPIHVPPLDVQSSIASILKALDDRIALLRETNATLEAIAQALFKSWFVDFDPVHANASTQAPSLPPEIQALFPATFTDSPQGPIPDGWCFGNLGDELKIAYGKNLPTTKLLETGYPVFGGNGQIGFFSDYLYEERQVLVACRGAASGKVNQSLPKSFVTNNSLVLEFNSKLPFGYLKGFMSLSDLSAHVTGSAQPQVTIDNLKGFKIMVPNAAAVNAYESISNSIENKIEENNTQGRALAELRDTLLPRLISGQLRLPEAEQAIAAITD